MNYNDHKPLTKLVEQYEAKVIESVLHACQGNKTAAAKQLGISIRNLYYKLEKYGLDKKSMQ